MMMMNGPSTVEAFGVRTGVTRRSRPMRYWRSTANSSGSSGNSKKRARTGGVPCIDAFANNEYYVGTNM